jgi:nicotinamidase/pyrazinamidase
MPAQRLVFVDIDTQRDFLEPSGALPVPGAGSILGALRGLTEHARARGIPVLATACNHGPDDEELRAFPAHCMAGTPGQQRVAATAWEGGVVLSPEQAFEGPGVPPHLTLEKRTIDVFGRPDAERVVAAYGAGDPRFVVYGVATDYCVRCAVFGLLARGRAVAVVADAVRAIDARREAEILTEFVRAGATLTVAARVIRPDAA